MFKKSIHDSIDRFQLLAWLLSTFLLLTPWNALGGVHELCSYADRLELDTTFRGDDGGRGCYRPLVGYKLRTGFASRVSTKDVEENDEDGSEIKAQRKPDLGAFALCAGLSERLETYGIADFDDHGDTPLCATPLELGGSVSGVIDNAAGDDEDVFTFVVDELLSVEVAATAGHLTLYDGRGQRLASIGNGMEDPRLVRTLSPGRYYVRLQNLWGSGKRYFLSLVASDEPLR